MYLTCLQQFVDLKILSSDLLEKPFVDYLKVCDVYTQVKNNFFFQNYFWQPDRFPWGAYFKMLIRILLINFVIT